MAAERKYELTKNMMVYYYTVLYQIRAVKDFKPGEKDDDHPIVKKGDLGGWIEGEENLSHEGNCWVEDNAMVFGNAKVHDDAIVSENANVYGNAEVYDSALVYGNAKVLNNSKIFGSAKVFGSAVIGGNANILGEAEVSGYTTVKGNAVIEGRAIVEGTKLKEWYGKKSNALVIDGGANIRYHAEIHDKYDFFTFDLPWLSCPTVTWTKDSWAIGWGLLDMFDAEAGRIDDDYFINLVKDRYDDEDQEEIAKRCVEIAHLLEKVAAKKRGEK